MGAITAYGIACLGRYLKKQFSALNGELLFCSTQLICHPVTATFKFFQQIVLISQPRFIIIAVNYNQ